MKKNKDNESEIKKKNVLFDLMELGEKGRK